MACPLHLKPLHLVLVLQVPAAAVVVVRMRQRKGTAWRGEHSIGELPPVLQSCCLLPVHLKWLAGAEAAVMLQQP
jgi:hypothetical protein